MYPYRPKTGLKKSHATVPLTLMKISIEFLIG
jgi:hypothetical protein